MKFIILIFVLLINLPNEFCQENQDVYSITSEIRNLEIPFDTLPENIGIEKIMLDNLENNDTLFINVYIAAAGEWGGYDEGLWIFKIDNQVYGRFYSLPNTYALQLDSSKVIKKYMDNKSQITSLTENIKLKEHDIKAINSFLIEIYHYHDKYFSNATEHFLIYTRKGGIYRIKNNYYYKPYIELKEKIIKGL